MAMALAGDVTQREQRILRELEAKLALPPLEESEATCAPHWLAEGVAELLRADVGVVYRPQPTPDDSWQLGEFACTRPGYLERYNAFIVEHALKPFHYDPRRPEPEQRNRVRTMAEVHSHGPETTCIVEQAWHPLGMHGDQLRALVCEGARLLAWVGAIRDEPFTKRERDLLQRLVEPMLRPLLLRRRLADAKLAATGLAAALEALSAPAMIVDARGAMHARNRAAEALSGKSGGRAISARARALIDGTSTDGDVATLPSGAGSPSYLVVLREPRGAEAARLDAVAREWSVSPRERSVLLGLVRGDSNKEMALELGCAEVTVERHVTALLRKAKVESRARLVARFWATR